MTDLKKGDLLNDGKYMIEKELESVETMKLNHESGEYNKITELIKSTQNINAKDGNGNSALHIGKY
jgi:hypothetical protein